MRQRLTLLLMLVACAIARPATAADPIAESLHALLITLGIARPRALAA